MISEENVRALLAEADNRIIELDQFIFDSKTLGLEIIECEFIIMKRFYQERVELLNMVLDIESLPF